MIINQLVSPRNIIPRWRLFNFTFDGGVLLPLVSQAHLEDLSDLDAKLFDWEKTKNISSAIELVESSLFHNKPDLGIEAASMLLLEENSIKNDVLSMANRLVETVKGKPLGLYHILNIDKKTSIYKQIFFLKERLRFNPDNPIAWMDLSYYYTILAQVDKAVDSMRKAMALSNSNRLITRAASRLFVHIGQPDTAKVILSGGEASRDPWLLSAQIAVNQVLNERPSNINLAKRLSQSRKFSPLQISELSSALATFEFFEGNVHQSKKLLKLSLREPTENSIAQAIWLLPDYVNTLPLKESLVTDLKAFEARALELTKLLKWEDAMVAAEEWLKDEPFSSRPAIFGSFIAAAGLEDYPLSEEYARKGLIANPDDLLLKNNLAYALANQNRVEEAITELSQVDTSGLPPNLQVTILATKGLINLRSNNIGEGKMLYDQAIDLAKKNNLVDIMASALINYAKELVLSGQTTIAEAKAMIEEPTRSTTNPYIKYMKMSLEQFLEQLPIE